MHFRAFAERVSEVVSQSAAFNVFLGVVPGTTSVGSGGGHHATGDNSTGQEASEHLGAEDESDNEGRKHDLNKRIKITRSPGAIISQRAALVEIAMQDL